MTQSDDKKKSLKDLVSAAAELRQKKAGEPGAEVSDSDKAARKKTDLDPRALWAKPKGPVETKDGGHQSELQAKPGDLQTAARKSSLPDTQDTSPQLRTQAAAAIPETEEAKPPVDPALDRPRGKGLMSRLRSAKSKSATNAESGELHRASERTKLPPAEPFQKSPGGDAATPQSSGAEAVRAGIVVPEVRARRVSPSSGKVAQVKGVLEDAADRSSFGLKLARRRTGQFIRLGRKAFWRGLRKRTNFKAVARDYRTLISLTHRYIFDRDIEKLFFVPTQRRIPLEGLTIASARRRAGKSYKATPRLIFDWAMGVLPHNLKEFHFYDIGAGRGRVLLLASRYNFAQIRGLEFSRELHDNAVMNIAQFPRSRMRCRDVECQLGDALDLEIPLEKLVFFLYDPFTDAMLEQFMRKLVASYREEPRRIYLIFVDPPADEIMQRLVEESNIFSSVPLGSFREPMVKYLSPNRLSIYRSHS